MEYKKVVAAIVTYGERWKHLQQVLDTLVHDPHIVEIVVVNNASRQGEEIKKYAALHPVVHVIHNDTNRGSAGGYNQALSRAREVECDFVFVLDDDNVPEKGAIALFLTTLTLFEDKKVVLVGNRHQQNSEPLFYTNISNDAPRMTFFNVFSFRKLFRFLGFSVDIKGLYTPIVPTEAFAFGGSFLPIEAVRTTALPDPSLVLYGDDIEYSWNVKNNGFSSYLCYRPYIHDIDMTFSKSHIVGLFEPTTKAFTVYYRIRNMVKLSLKHSRQNRLVLIASVITWISILLLLGLYRKGFSSVYKVKALLLLRAVADGFTGHVAPPEVSLP